MDLKQILNNIPDIKYPKIISDLMCKGVISEVEAYNKCFIFTSYFVKDATLAKQCTFGDFYFDTPGKIYVSLYCISNGKNKIIKAIAESIFISNSGNKQSLIPQVITKCDDLTVKDIFNDYKFKFICTNSHNNNLWAKVIRSYNNGVRKRDGIEEDDYIRPIDLLFEIDYSSIVTENYILSQINENNSKERRIHELAMCAMRTKATENVAKSIDVGSKYIGDSVFNGLKYAAEEIKMPHGHITMC